MATTMQLSDLITAVRQRSDMVNSQFVTDTEVTSYINQSYFELYDLLVEKFGNNYFISTPYLITSDGVTEFYALPTDFYKLAGLSIQIFGAIQNWQPMIQGSFGDMQARSGTSVLSVWSINDCMYQLNANNLWVAPAPEAGITLRMFYVPRLTPLVNSTDTVDGISGWTEYIIVDAAIKCAQKEESDVSVLEGQKNALIKRIDAASSNRDMASPSKVTDVSDNTYNYSYLGSWGLLP